MIRVARRRGDDGFTVTESIVALTLFGMFAAMLLPLVLSTMRLTVESQRRATAARIAAQAVNQVRDLIQQGAYLDVVGDSTVPVGRDIEQTVVLNNKNLEYYASGSLLFRPVDAGAVPLCDGSPDATYPSVVVDIEVEVTWEGAQSAPVRVTQRHSMGDRAFVAIRVHDDGDPVPGVLVYLAQSLADPAQPPTGLTESNVISRYTDGDGCAVFELNLATQAATSYWYATDTLSYQSLGWPPGSQPRPVNRDGSYVSGFRSVGWLGDGPGVAIVNHEMRPEAVLRVTFVDQTDVLMVDGDDEVVETRLTGLSGAETADWLLSLHATDGIASDGVQVRETAEADDPTLAVLPTNPFTGWYYPLRYRDLGPDEIWWDDDGDGTPPREYEIRALWPADYTVWAGGAASVPAPVYVELARGADVQVLVARNGTIVAVRTAAAGGGGG